MVAVQVWGPELDGSAVVFVPSTEDLYILLLLPSPHPLASTLSPVALPDLSSTC